MEIEEIVAWISVQNDGLEVGFKLIQRRIADVGHTL